MIGHYLLSLTPHQEHRVLTRVMHAHSPTDYGWRNLPPYCLVQTVFNGQYHKIRDSAVQFRNNPSLMARYDRLCARFGEPRVHAAIRNRILSNQARRVLSVERRALRGAATPTEPQK